MHRLPLTFFLLLLLCSFQTFAKEGTGETKISFTENKGQLHDQNNQPRADIVFYGNTAGMNYYLKKNGLSYQILRSEQSPVQERKTSPTTIQRVDIEWLNVNSNPKITTGKTLNGVEHFYTSATPILSVRSFEHILYNNLYTGIDLKYYEHSGSLKYDYIVHPGANPNNIQLKVRGATIARNNDGTISIHTPLGTITEGKPVVFQEGRSIAAAWKLTGDVLSFDIDAYDKSKPLIIDPLVFAWSAQSQFGGGAWVSVYGTAATVDGSGNVIWCGKEDHPFVNKRTPANAYVFQKSWGSFSPHPATSCNVDGMDNIYVTGSTTSNILVATAGAYQTSLNGSPNGFISKVSNTGTIQWSTYYGAGNNDYIHSGSVDQMGNVYVVGQTSSTSAMSTAGAHQMLSGGGVDGFIAKFNTFGIRVWSTYYGGSAADNISGSSINTTGLLYVCGTTKSATGIATTGSYQSSFSGVANGFIAQLDTNGNVQWSTYYGADSTIAEKCALDDAGNLYICGTTNATAGIATSGTFQSTLTTSSDGYVAKFNTSGSRIWGSYLGGNGAMGRGVDVNNNGKLYVAGSSFYSANIATPGANQTSINGYSAYLQEFDTSGQKLWGTYYGGVPWGSLGNNCYADDSGYVYLLGSVRATSLGSGNNFIARFRNYTVPTPVINTSSTSFCQGSTVTLSIPAIATATYQWYLGGSPISGATSNTYVANTAGDYTVTIVHNSSSATSTAVTLTSMAVPSTTVAKTDLTCNNIATGAISVTASGGTTPYSYSWTNTSNTSSSASGLLAGTYIITTTGANLCFKKDTVTLTQPSAITTTESQTNVSCFGGSNGAAGVTVTGGTPPYTYSWNSGPTTSSISSVTAGMHIITITDNNGCTRKDTITVTEPTALTAIHIQTDNTCFGQNSGVATLAVSGGTTPYSYLWSNGITTASNTGLAAGVYTVVTTDNHNCTRNDTFTITQPADIIRTLTTVDNDCFNDSVGKAFVLVAGGVAPYVYQWSDGSMVDSATGLHAGMHILQTVDANGCMKTDTFTINEPPQALVNVCAVTVDSVTGKNLVIWEKSGIQNDMLYKVYRETFISGQYNLIGAKWSHEMSTLEDTSSIPLQQSYSYKVSVVDSCNNESPLSDFHKTIHLTSNVGINNEVNLIWNAYEGTPYSTHHIMRSNNGGPFVNIAQVSSTSTSYSDLTPPSGQKDYRIDIDIATACNPTAKTTAYSYVSSNVVTLDPTDVPGIPGSANITLYPNPSSGIVYIKGTNPARILVEDVTGKVLLSYEGKNEISLQQLAAGAYIIKLFDKDNNRYYQQKVIKQ